MILRNLPLVTTRNGTQRDCPSDEENRTLEIRHAAVRQRVWNQMSAHRPEGLVRVEEALAAAREGSCGAVTLLVASLYLSSRHLTLDPVYLHSQGASRR